MRQLTAIVLCLLHTNLAAQDTGEDEIEFWNALGRKHIMQKQKHAPFTQKGPKNVIFFVGDGMGLSMVTAGRIVQAQKHNRSYHSERWSFERFDYSGILMTSSYDFHTTDSAAGAMALFTGIKGENNILGRKPNYGDSCEKGAETYVNDGIAELALKRDMDVGIVTTARITDATPAANYAKGVHRQMEHDQKPRMRNSSCIDIAAQLLQEPATKFKVIMGGGHSFFTPVEDGGYRGDGKNLEKEWLGLDNDRQLLRSREGLQQYSPSEHDHVLGLFSDESFEYYLKDKQNKSSTQPRLIEMATKALDVLQKSDNDNGYFLMIEGSQIDVAEHANQMHLATEELVEFAETIEKIRSMVSDDTLIVVTADHAHALTLPGYVHREKFLLDAEIEPDGNDVDHQRVPNVLFGAGPGVNTSRDFTEAEMNNIEFHSPAAYAAHWNAHGAEDIGIWTQGPYAWLFSGTMENTQVAYNIKYLLCLDANEPSLCRERSDPEEEMERLSRIRNELNEMEKHSSGSPTFTVIVLAATTLFFIVTSVILAGILILRVIRLRNDKVDADSTASKKAVV